MNNLTIEKLQETEEIKDNVLNFPKEILDIIIDYKNDMENITECIDICESINNQLEKKLRTKSTLIYDRNIKLITPMKYSELENIMICNIDKTYNVDVNMEVGISMDVKVDMLYDMNIKEVNDKLVKTIYLHFNPITYYDYLYVLLH